MSHIQFRDSKKVIIKPLKKTDIPEVYKLWGKSGLRVKPEGRDSAAHLSKEIDGNESIFLKAIDDSDSKIIGVVLGTHDGRKGWINRLSVHPEYRQKGVAKKLIEAVEDNLNEMGIFIITSLIEEYNSKSMKLFESLGYKKHTDITYFTKRKNDKI